MQFIRSLNDVRRECDALHDPLAFKLINKRQKKLMGDELRVQKRYAMKHWLVYECFPVFT